MYFYNPISLLIINCLHAICSPLTQIRRDRKSIVAIRVRVRDRRRLLGARVLVRARRQGEGNRTRSTYRRDRMNATRVRCRVRIRARGHARGETTAGTRIASNDTVPEEWPACM